MFDRGMPGVTLGLVLVASGVVAQAQESGWSSGLKVRTALQAASRKDGLGAMTLGFGLEVGYAVPAGRMSAELGFMTKPGSQRRADVGGMAVSPEGLAAGAGAPASEISVDSRKGQVDILGLRLAYEKPLGGLALRCGVQLGTSQFRQEYIADVSDGATYRDTYNGVAKASRFTVSPFLGVTLPLGIDQALEIQALGLSYQSANYVHVAGTELNGDGGHTRLDSVQKVNRLVPHLELTYVFRF